MKRIFFIPLAVILITHATGCGPTRKTHGELTKRYSNATEDRLTSIDKYIVVEGYAFNPDKASPPKPLLAYQLPTSVVEKLVYAFYRNDATSADIIKSLSSPLTISKPTSDDDFVIDNRTTFNKRLVFSIRNESFFPADRIWKLTVSVTKTDTMPIRFVSSSVLATEFTNVDVGKLAYNRVSALDASITGGLGGGYSNSSKNIDASGNEINTENSTATNADNLNSNTSTSQNKNTGSATKENNSSSSLESKISGTVGYKNQFTTNEEVALKQRYVKLTGSVKENSLSLYQESTSGIDLSGSVIADVEFGALNSQQNSVAAKLTFQFRNLKTAAVFNPVADVNVKQIVVAYPNITSDISGTISFKGVVRKVEKKDNTIAESDDKVKFIGGTTNLASPETMLLLSQKEITPDFWYLRNSAGSPVKIQTPFMSAPVDLAFRSYDDGQNFILWLKAQRALVVAAAGQIGGTVQLFPGAGVAATFTVNEINSMYIRIQ